MGRAVWRSARAAIASGGRGDPSPTLEGVCAPDDHDRDLRGPRPRRSRPRAHRSMIDDPAMDERLENPSEAAAARRDFGEPTIFVGDDVLFGNYRLHFVQDHRARAP
jgi:hypothetical protein